jgi:hypothetical protein
MASVGPVLGFFKEYTGPAVGQTTISFDHIGVLPGVGVWASIVEIDANTHQTYDDINVRLAVLQVVPNYSNFGADVRVNLDKLSGADRSIPTSFRLSLFVQLEQNVVTS